MNLVHDFDEVVNRRGTDSKKYSVYPEDVIPMWIADSDFKAPQPVVDALVERVQQGVYGYTPVSPITEPKQNLDGEWKVNVTQAANVDVENAPFAAADFNDALYLCKI